MKKCVQWLNVAIKLLGAKRAEEIQGSGIDTDGSSLKCSFWNGLLRVEPVEGISERRRWDPGWQAVSLLRVLSERCVCVSESWREGSMNKADSMNYSEWFWMPWGKNRGLLYVYVCVCVCVRSGHWSHRLRLRSHLNLKLTDTWDSERSMGIDSIFLFKEV